ncbi:MAG: hypothetical protein WKH97_10965 [Casimicrobiaceae bacterium]
MATEPRTLDATMDVATLYREEVYTDRKVGTLRVLVPVKSDGGKDTARATVYTGETQLMTNMGPLPISFDIAAKDLGEAVQKYAEAAKTGIEHTMRELQELRRQQSSSLIVPPAGAAAALGAGGTLGGGMPRGGGKIQMP